MRYEFGTKVSVAATIDEGFILGMRALRPAGRGRGWRGGGRRSRYRALPARQQRSRGKARIHAHHRHLAQPALRPVDHIEDHVARALGGADIARPQSRVEHVAGLGDGGDQRVVDACVVVAVPLGLRLLAVALQLYARMIPDRDEWVRLEIESSPMPICTRSQVLRSARRT